MHLLIRTILAFMFVMGVAVGETGKVTMLKGAPALQIDGEPDSGMSYMTYVGPMSMDNGTPLLSTYTKSLANAGCNLYTFVVDLGGLYGYSPTVWPEENRWDFSFIDSSAHMILSSAQEARLIIQLFIDAPAWWSEKNPDELILLSDGKKEFADKFFALPKKGPFPSLASQKWRDDMKMVIGRVIEHVDQSDYGSRVVGYQVCGQKTEEWYHWSMNTDELGDYSPPMLNTFRGWLRERYRTDASLQKAWNKPEAMFDTATIPTKAERYGKQDATFRNPLVEQPVIDFGRYWSDIMADTIAYFARTVKEKTGGTKIVGGFYGYLLEFADLAEDAGHIALYRLMRSPDIDFIMTPSSYYRRDLKGGQSSFRLPVRSLALHQKMLWSDFDPASFKFYGRGKELEQWKGQLAVTDTAEEFTWMIRRELGNALANGVNVAHFDLHGGYYEDPQILECVKQETQIRKDALNRDRTSSAQVLFVVDEDSFHYVTFRNTLLRRVLMEQVAEMAFVAPYDVVLLSDLAQTDIDRYKLVVMLNAFKLDEAQRTLLHEIERDGRNILWLYAPGYFNGGSEPGVAHIAEVIGIKVELRPKPDSGVACKFDIEGAPDVPLPNGDAFVIADSDATVLARRNDNAHEPVVARRTLGKWTSIYSAVAPLPKQVLRTLCRDAGVHLYHDSPEDTVYANRDYLTLAAGGREGARTLRLPNKATVTDLFSGKELCRDAEVFTTDFKPWEVRNFRLENKPMTTTENPWYKRLMVGMEVGPTGAQFGCDPREIGYAAQFNGADIVRKQLEAHSEYIVIWAKDSEFAYYNSRVAPKCPGLGDRDVLRETVDAAAPHGLPVIAYCVVQGNGYPLRDHPEFKMVDAKGKPIDRICFNSGYLDHAKQVAAEMLEYGIAGFHIDMIDQGFEPPYGCWCPSCKTRFETEYGHPMPGGVTWDEDWDHMMELRFNTSARFERKLRDYIRGLAPKVTVDFNYHGSPPFSWEVGQRPVQHAIEGDFVTGETGIWGFSALGVSLTALFLNAAHPDTPYQIAMQRGVRMYHDQTCRPVNDMRWELLTLRAHGAQVTIVDKTPFDGTLDPITFQRVGEVFQEACAKAPHFGQTPVQDVGLYYSSRSRDWYGREEPSKYQQSFAGVHKALTYEHITTGVLLDENASLDRLKTFPVVLLPNAAILSAKETALFRRYVEEGGNLVMTGITGLYGQRGEVLNESVMTDLIGARAKGVLPSLDNYVRLAKATLPAEGIARDIPTDWSFLVEGPAVAFEATTAIPVGELLKPVRTLRQQQGLEGTVWPGSAGVPVGPAILINRVGKGTVVCLTCSPDAATAGEHPVVEARLLLRNLVRWLNPAPRVDIAAPLNVEAVVTDDPAARMLRIHFLGYLSPPTTTPAKNRPYVLPALIEEPPLYRANIRFNHPCKDFKTLNPETALTVKDPQNVQLRVNDIHETLIASY